MTRSDDEVAFLEQSVGDADEGMADYEDYYESLLSNAERAYEDYNPNENTEGLTEDGLRAVITCTSRGSLPPAA